MASLYHVMSYLTLLYPILSYPISSFRPFPRHLKTPVQCTNDNAKKKKTNRRGIPNESETPRISQHHLGMPVPSISTQSSPWYAIFQNPFIQTCPVLSFRSFIFSSSTLVIWFPSHVGYRRRSIISRVRKWWSRSTAHWPVAIRILDRCFGW